MTPFAGAELADKIARTVHELDTHSVRDLTALLAKVPSQRHISAAA
ncbi:hypothetical protein LRK55_15100 [Rhodanobacter denitrificans]|nr:hypothetical protein [Rhodanobacter denitrificans]UJJ60397.1 hypothetical protein LRK55_15100 [Rhodanobacter denitrificans]